MVTLTYGVVKTHVSSDDPLERKAVFHLLDEHLSFFKSGYFFSPQYQMGVWDGKQHFFSVTTGLLYSGWVSRALQYLRQQDIPFELIGYPAPLEVANDTRDIVLPDGTVLYTHQSHAVRQVERYSRGVLQIATNGGKTAVATALIQRYGIPPTCYFVPRSVLVKQVATSIEKRLGISVGRIGAGFNDPNPEGVTVAMTHSTSQRLQALAKATRKADKAAIDVGFVQNAHLMFGDECHLSSDPRYQRSIEGCKAPIRVLMSGSPFKKDPVERGFVQAYGGPLLAVVHNDEMVEKGISAKVNVMLLEPKIGLVRKVYYQGLDYRDALAECDERNQLIACLARAFVSCGLQFMVMVQKVEHGKAIHQWIPEATLTHGGASNRKKVENKLRNGDVFCCICTTIFDTGFDTPHIQGLAYAGGGPDHIRLAQSLGRLLRQNETKDKSPWFFDFYDTHHKVLKTHASARRKYLKTNTTFNFTEDFALLPPGVYSKFVAELASFETLEDKTLKNPQRGDGIRGDKGD